MSDRYVVIAVTGWAVTPGTASAASGHAQTTSLSVLDTAYAYEEVFSEYAGRAKGRYAARARRAYAECARLNAADAADVAVAA